MKPEEPEIIACEVCKKEIPKAAALHAEGKDYVLYFCDIKCLDYWKRQRAGLPPQDKRGDGTKDPEGRPS